MYNYEIITSSEEEKSLIKNLHSDLPEHIEMAEYEYNFLTTLIRRKKPKKLLELGVSQGGSSAILLNAIKDFDDSFLYSIDYNTNHYRLKDKKTGFYMNNYPELKKKWKLSTGGLALNFMDEIGDGIDFCFIDTVHCNPGEILDFLMVLPYLKEDATVVFHDTNLQYYALKRRGLLDFQFTNNLLMSAVTGKKLLPFLVNDSGYKFSNIGAIELNSQTMSSCWDIFNLLTIEWVCPPTNDELSALSLHFKKFYPQEFCTFFDAAVSEMKGLFHKKVYDDLSKFLDVSDVQELKLTPSQKLFSTFKINGKRIVVLFGKIFIRI